MARLRSISLSTSTENTFLGEQHVAFVDFCVHYAAEVTEAAVLKLKLSDLFLSVSVMIN